MPLAQCVSLKADGARCTKNGDPAHDGMCGTHHNQKMRQDPAYAVRFAPAAPPALVRHDAVVDLPQRAPQRAPRVVQVVLGAQQHQVNQALRRYNRLRTDIINLRDAIQRFTDLGRAQFHNDELFDQLEPKMHELATIFERIQPLREQENAQLENQILADLEAIRHFIRRAQTAAQPAIRRHREHQLADMFMLLIANDFGEDDMGAVVFQRDPEGSVNLRAFAQDAQSVHRSSVQEMAQKGMEKILAGPAPSHGADTLFEITVAFTTPTISWSAGQYEQTIQELHRDYEIGEAFGVKYSRVMNHLWAFIKAHVERIELTRRLAEELNEGRGMCSNGKMARLVNVLQGYDESVAIIVAPQREQFQSKIATLASHPLDERRDAAMALFAEYNIPAAEHEAWLEPLLDM
jgi:hypothetical protein